MARPPSGPPAPLAEPPRQRQALPVLALPVLALTVLAGGGLLGCGGTLPWAEPACTYEYRPGLLVYVRDATTAWPMAGGATVIARDGAFVDTLHHARFSPTGDTLSLAGAYERAGLYTLWVEHPGYLSREWPPVEVREGPCGVRTVTLAVPLVRAR